MFDIFEKYHLKTFENAAGGLDKKLLARKQLEVAVGTFGHCVFLKLYKKTWANPSRDPLTSPSRIFFSVWVDPKKEQELFYNIHALKLRQLNGYKIESRKFAGAFRTFFKDFEHQWENVSVKFGPLTLMQGSVKVPPEDLQDNILELSNNFLAIEHLVDDTLAMFSAAGRK